MTTPRPASFPAAGPVGAPVAGCRARAARARCVAREFRTRRRGGARRRVEKERGSGTVLVLGLAAVVVLLGTVLAGLGQAQAAHSAAQGAADLAALAGADALRHGEDACAVGRAVAERNGGVLDTCVDEGGGVVRVQMHRDAPGVARLVGAGARATATARAGPASARAR
ncbi:Rv3654c family TadE-like protein [Luteimicrobium sp. NPDC057192]|uniref:Rv3654c family TadE-like protein n=1 Tax=Luteimicrobium sp. NPDC057192 TaxID=3346042 RepID=UPI00363C2F44